MTTNGPSAERRRIMFFSLVGPHLNRLHHFVRHVLGDLRATGELRPAELTADEVVDSVLLRAYREFVSEPVRRRTCPRRRPRRQCPRWATRSSTSMSPTKT
jgi:hypothetical protein